MQRTCNIEASVFTVRDISAWLRTSSARWAAAPTARTTALAAAASCSTAAHPPRTGTADNSPACTLAGNPVGTSNTPARNRTGTAGFGGWILRCCPTRTTCPHSYRRFPYPRSIWRLVRWFPCCECSRLRVWLILLSQTWWMRSLCLWRPWRGRKRNITYKL